MVKYVCDAWGKCKVLNASGVEITNTSNIGLRNPFRYRGYYLDANTGLYYLKSRFYDPETGRFLNADTIDYLEPDAVNGLNLYAYCGNNPIMNVDPMGHKWYEFWNWDWASIGKVALGIGIITGLVIGSIFTGGMLSVILAGAAIGAGAGFVSGLYGYFQNAFLNKEGKFFGF